MRRMHENSIKAYREYDPAPREAEVLSVIGKSLYALTDREVAEQLGYKDMNAVRPTITNLVDVGVLAEVDRVKDEKTGRTVRATALVVKLAHA